MKLHIVSGFLGAGKTTYIKELIKDLKGEIAIIENEFGDVSLDHLEFDADYYVKNIYAGCICCSLIGDLYEALKEISQKHDVDHIIIEPSGVAMLSQVLRVCKRLQKDYDLVLEEVVTLVDCKNYFDYQENFGGFYMDQIRHGDKLLLTHNDGLEDIKIKEDLLKIKEAKNIFSFDLIDYSTKEAIESITLYPRLIDLNDIQGLENKIKEKIFGNTVRIKGYIKTNLGHYKLDYITGKLNLIKTEEKSSVLVFIGSQLNKTEINNQFI